MMEYVKQESNLYENFQNVYALTFGNCTNHIRSKLEYHKYYQMLRWGYNMLLIMGSIKGLTLKFCDHKNLLHALHNSNKDFCQY